MASTRTANTTSRQTSSVGHQGAAPHRVVDKQSHNDFKATQLGGPAGRPAAMEGKRSDSNDEVEDDVHFGSSNVAGLDKTITTSATEPTDPV
ncbi:uncharacterized protein PG998_008697 [Apiospora kogelbergensis]|uniref:uncharacterized protein n=1 Tax=Apiospora kogelbergensis TaxID=1337665 RepID=UPI00312CF6DB